MRRILILVLVLAFCTVGYANADTDILSEHFYVFDVTHFNVSRFQYWIVGNDGFVVDDGVIKHEPRAKMLSDHYLLLILPLGSIWEFAVYDIETHDQTMIFPHLLYANEALSIRVDYFTEDGSAIILSDLFQKEFSYAVPVAKLGSIDYVSVDSEHNVIEVFYWTLPDAVYQNIRIDLSALGLPNDILLHSNAWGKGL